MWSHQGWYCLVFIPHGNYEQYASCYDIENRFGDHVRLASYEVYPDTCGTSMVVGESRNAILAFLKRYIDVFKTCVISDERISAASYGIKQVGRLKRNFPKKTVDIDAFRHKYGYKVMGLVKDFIAGDATAKDFEKAEQDFQTDFEELPIGKGKRPYKLATKMLSYDGKVPSLWHYLGNRKPTLVGFASGRVNNNYAVWEQPLRETDEQREKEKIAQFCMFKVGGKNGWSGQQLYTKTTMCEDNVWSYEWSKNIGPVAEVFCVGMKRERGLSLTRRMVDLNTYSVCALLEMVKALESDSYKVVRDKVYMRWTVHSQNIALHLAKPPVKGETTNSEYWHMAALLSGVADACRNKKIPVPQKIKDIGRVLKKAIGTYIRQESANEQAAAQASEPKKDESSDSDEYEIPWDLSYLGKTRLEKLPLNTLKEECKKRHITCGQRGTCIRKLLEWKKSRVGESKSFELPVPEVRVPQHDIPKVIHQTWKDDKLTGLAPSVKRNTQKWQNANPDYEYKLYGNVQCVEYLETHFPDEDYVWAFEQLVPGAFKADFFRYALLFNEGGVYLDIDTAPLDVTLDEMLEKAEYPDFLSVREAFMLPGVWQAFIACKPGIPFLKVALDQIVSNIKNKWYPPDVLSLWQGRDVSLEAKNTAKNGETKKFFKHMGLKKLNRNNRWGSNFRILAFTGPTLLSSSICKWMGKPLEPLPMRVRHKGVQMHFFYLAPRPNNVVKFNHKTDPGDTDLKTDVFITTADGYDERDKDSYYASAWHARRIYQTVDTSNSAWTSPVSPPALSTPQPETPPAETGYTIPWDYVVQKSERISDIAERTGFDINDLIAVNAASIEGLKTTSKLRPGTELTYPRYMEYSSEPQVLGKGLQNIRVMYDKRDRKNGNRTVVLEIKIMHRDKAVDVALKMFQGDRYSIEKELDITQLGYAVQDDITLYYAGKHTSFYDSVLKSIYDEYFRSGVVGVIIMTDLNTLAEHLIKYRDARYARYPKYGPLKKVKQDSSADWKRNTYNLILKLHRIGIVHGDLKYGNVLINESSDDDLGKVYIIDFERSLKKQDASFQDEWDALPHATPEDVKRRNKTCLRDMRDIFGENII